MKALLRSAAPCAMALALGGCTIAGMRDDNAAAERHIQSQQGQLAAEQRTQAALQARRRQLLDDLSSAQTDAARLQAQLDEMNRINEQAPTATPEQRQVRAERSQKLSAAARQARDLDRDQTLSRQEKQKRLDELKEKTRAMLTLLLVG